MVLNDVLLGLLPPLDGRAVLELGAGNGYFAKALARLKPNRLVVSDASERLLAIAHSRRRARGAEYVLLDVSDPFPFEAGAFDVILTTMMWNELPAPILKRSLRECARVLRPEGSLLATITHPAFVASLEARGQLRKPAVGPSTMPGARGVRTPVYPRSEAEYLRILHEASWICSTRSVEANAAVLSEKPGLREAGHVPIALVFECRREGNPKPSIEVA